MHCRESELMFHATLKGNSGINQQRQLRNNVNSTKDYNHFSFVTVCRQLACAVYFVIMPIDYTLSTLIAYE